MASPLTSAEFRRLLQTDLREVSDDVLKKQYLMSQIGNFFTMATSQKAWEEYLSVSEFPDVPEFTGELEYLPRYAGWHTKVEHKRYAAGIQTERELVDDDQYGVIENNTRGLNKSAARTREKQGRKLFTGSFSIAFEYQSNEENKPLCSTTHLSKSGASTTTGFSNSSTNAFSKDNLEAARLAMMRFKTDIGERFEASQNYGIVYPMALDSDVREVVETPAGYNTAYQNINVENRIGYKLFPYPLLDEYDTNDWWLVDIDAMKEACIWFDRIMPDYNNWIEEENFILKESVYFRLSWLWKDWRWVYGNQVS